MQTRESSCALRSFVLTLLFGVYGLVGYLWYLRINDRTKKEFNSATLAGLIGITGWFIIYYFIID